MLTPTQLDVMARHYCIAAAWADCPEGTHPRVTRAALAYARTQCERLATLAPELVAEALQRPGYGAHPDCGTVEPACAAMGHDLYLTCAGHGAGFWDRAPLDEGELGDRLAALCGWRKPVNPGEAYFYRGWLYFVGGE